MGHSRKFEEISNRIGAPSHRHAAPSAPWPWVDIQDDGECPKKIAVLSFLSPTLRHAVDHKQLETSEPSVPSPCDHQGCDNCWKDYPQSLFPNWTPAQIKKSKIGIAIQDYPRDVPCVIHHVDVDDNGHFRDSNKHVTTESTIKESWDRTVRARVSTTMSLDPFVLKPPPDTKKPSILPSTGS